MSSGAGGGLFWRPGAPAPDVTGYKGEGGGTSDAALALPSAPMLHVARHSLPIAEYRRSFLYAVEMYGVVVFVGDTGCGKSTRTCCALRAAPCTLHPARSPCRLACAHACACTLFALQSCRSTCTRRAGVRAGGR
ncbi:hypothetical protein EON68_00085 [archaeon]|nr:MAG: hypothetical protein EON68_00085 [archaeon]